MKKYLLKWSDLGPFSQLLVSSGVLIILGMILISVNEFLKRPTPLE